MTDDERKLLFETAASIGALLEVLGDGEGLHSIQGVRRGFRERASELIVALHKQMMAAQAAGGGR